jgi:type II secretory pathway pseudopilin PulG
LVIVAIVALLAALLFPTLSVAKRAAQRTACLSNLRQIGIAIQMYAGDSDDNIPYGPVAPAFTSPAGFYPSTGAPTSLLSLRSGEPVALGLLLRRYLANGPRVFFCPGTDQPVDGVAELAKVGTTQAQGGYYYRHGGNTRLFDTSSDPTPRDHLRLHNLGLNREGRPVRALAIDTQFLSPPELTTFNVKSSTHHGRKLAGILFSDGSARSRRNTDERFTVDIRDYAELRDAFNKILKVFEQADRDP